MTSDRIAFLNYYHIITLATVFCSFKFQISLPVIVSQSTSEMELRGKENIFLAK